jgi:hypothetical protein
MRLTRFAVLFFLTVLGIAALLAGVAGAIRSQQGERPGLTDPIPSPPAVFSTEPDPTTPPLVQPLTYDQALKLALEIDKVSAIHLDASADSLASLAKVTLHPSLTDADKAIGLETWYALELEADAGEVWVVAFPGAVQLVMGPGIEPSQNLPIHDGISYQFSARTGELLGVITGPPLD